MGSHTQGLTSLLITCITQEMCPSAQSLPCSHDVTYPDYNPYLPLENSSSRQALGQINAYIRNLQDVTVSRTFNL